MKLKNSYLSLILLVVSFSSCDNDDKIPKTVPTVTTSNPTNVTMTSASVGGTITDKGNDVIQKSGIVYSSNVALPTIADNKVESTVLDGPFTAEISGLSSGTTYHVRAFATNSVGTSYGTVIDFSTGNAAPLANDLSITGTLEVGKSVTASYEYKDAESDPEGQTSFQWYMATSSTGTGEAAITDAIAKTLVITDALNGKFLKVKVTPKATSGTMQGVDTNSAYTSSPVGSETVTFSYGGNTVTYGTILSATTQRKWLDRNLGATRVAQAINDYQAYGDLFQWGRVADGHQFVTRTGTSAADATFANGITLTTEPYGTSSTDEPSNSKFIVVPTGDNLDWRNPQNNDLWQGVNGKNNPCPSGWRIPTQAEWFAEGFTNGNDAYAKLKLTVTGQRGVLNGNLRNVDYGIYWSSTSIEDPGYGFYTNHFQMTASTVGSSSSFTDRGNGEACRCIKE
jgi:hypothetical protein